VQVHAPNNLKNRIKITVRGGSERRPRKLKRKSLGENGKSRGLKNIEFINHRGIRSWAEDIKTRGVKNLKKTQGFGKKITWVRIQNPFAHIIVFLSFVRIGGKQQTSRN